MRIIEGWVSGLVDGTTRHPKSIHVGTPSMAGMQRFGKEAVEGSHGHGTFMLHRHEAGERGGSEGEVRDTDDSGAVSSSSIDPFFQ